MLLFFQCFDVWRLLGAAQKPAEVAPTLVAASEQPAQEKTPVRNAA